VPDHSAPGYSYRPGATATPTATQSQTQAPQTIPFGNIVDVGSGAYDAWQVINPIINNFEKVNSLSFAGISIDFAAQVYRDRSSAIDWWSSIVRGGFVAAESIGIGIVSTGVGAAFLVGGSSASTPVGGVIAGVVAGRATWIILNSAAEVANENAIFLSSINFLGRRFIFDGI
jgi:hypothetical protein